MKSIIAVLVFVSEAYVGQVHPKQITLQALIDKSDCIFIVKKGAPYSRVEEVELDGSGKYPPHQSPWYRYEIIEVIKDGPETKPAPGSEIEARGAYDKSLLMLDRRYHLEGVSKSPIQDFYEAREEQIEKRDTFIVFLSWDAEEKRYAIAANGAFESKGLKQEIKYLMGKSGKSGRPDGKPER